MAAFECTAGGWKRLGNNVTEGMIKEVDEDVEGYNKEEEEVREEQEGREGKEGGDDKVMEDLYFLYYYK
ncbi:hypothetical protein M404DRAFT_29104 [Pisolithus tinctorius Marx 270]|uniref:Uncharacterized protein n=1 Tax=Pisolithus tinctorius Marx 270 TaxID=870435 RepID=A0A0C3NIU2_PISTI|nr:hypothetical protein M404DRAFT_29104 [Pisolithus tinctorius Marx 270]